VTVTGGNICETNIIYILVDCSSVNNQNKSKRYGLVNSDDEKGKEKYSAEFGLKKIGKI
jgi:beta-glucosidase/6-phospho-beta-glucosidase/beta-galactosidase